ncbi:hypothetical protein M427DRAFT_54159 [Gonapodya prolifera JEL478]|uniref:RING-type domain-containing protein n=1 Tax=Gonapodya prolifera (strain JEL478) TaxID=1344416 RepID=A0A139AMC7_GONPJ|nr:hypothetical protein M427DRAFT_54159 [Gonapodya prolifera JEL478]|eukprot:KXS17920.1 hypothetical protein M427DRAFT_54159 [Gonapodya prolifera JEL478]
MTDCAICQTPFLDADDVESVHAPIACATGCGHTFHAECLEPWYTRGNSRSAPCPMCRKKGEARAIFLDLRAILMGALGGVREGEGASAGAGDTADSDPLQQQQEQQQQPQNPNAQAETQPNDDTPIPTPTPSAGTTAPRRSSRRTALRRLLASLPSTPPPRAAPASASTNPAECRLCPDRVADLAALRTHAANLELRLTVLQTTMDARIESAREQWDLRRAMEVAGYEARLTAADARVKMAEEGAKREWEKVDKTRRVLDEERQKWEEEKRKWREEGELRRRKVARLEHELKRLTTTHPAHTVPVPTATPGAQAAAGMGKRSLPVDLLNLPSGVDADRPWSKSAPAPVPRANPFDGQSRRAGAGDVAGKGEVVVFGSDDEDTDPECVHESGRDGREMSAGGKSGARGNTSTTTSKLAYRSSSTSFSTTTTTSTTSYSSYSSTTTHTTDENKAPYPTVIPPGAFRTKKRTHPYAHTPFDTAEDEKDGLGRTPPRAVLPRAPMGMARHVQANHARPPAGMGAGGGGVRQATLGQFGVRRE